jgi:RNA polymerase sporulation-specific sigma factor
MMKFRMLGIDHQELEDLIQDTSLKIYLALHSLYLRITVLSPMYFGYIEKL